MVAKIFIGDENNQARELIGISNFAYNVMLPSNTNSQDVILYNGLNYTMPDHGWFVLNGTASSTTMLLKLTNMSNGMGAGNKFSTESGDTYSISLPAIKNSIIIVNYNNTSSVTGKFIPLYTNN